MSTQFIKGGAGSGNFGHAGRPGLLGGSGEGGDPSWLRQGKGYLEPNNALRTPSPRDYITRWNGKDLNEKSSEQVLKTLDRLTSKYGAPEAGIQIGTMRNGNAIASVSTGQRYAVSKEEAIRLHDKGEQILQLKRNDGVIVLYHQSKEGSTMSLRVDGPRGGKAWFGDKPENYGTKYSSVYQSSESTGRGHIDDTITHEYGHVLSNMAGVRDASRLPADKEVASIIKSTYAFTNHAECLAEAFKYYDAGGRDKKVVDYLNKNIFDKLPKK